MFSNPQQFVEETIRALDWHMEVLGAVSQLNLPDWAVGAGFVRNVVWDRLHGYERPTPLADIDVLYFNREDTNRQCDTDIEEALCKLLPNRPWSVRNQARMHFRNNDFEYRDTEDAISHWLETPTCVAARLEENDNLKIIAPYGLDDLLGLLVRPTAKGKTKYDQYLSRIHTKKWLQHWSRLKIEISNPLPPAPRAGPV